MDLVTLVEKQREYFERGITANIGYRKMALKRLENALKIWENKIYEALLKDLGKPRQETYMCELGLTLSEISYVKKHMKAWNKKKRVLTPLAQFISHSYTVRNPYGVVLIMSPWNYPLLLTLEPLIGAIAAGNCCILKPSAYSPATSAVIAEMIGKTFPREYIAVVEGGREENSELLEQKFDYIFFTGGVNVGKLVMKKAAENLTPVTLELGGKSPCIVDDTANIKIAAKRIVFGKFLNSGQTCVAPDYVLVCKSVKEKLVSEIISCIQSQYGDNPLADGEYVNIINEKHFLRVKALIDDELVVYGGGTDRERLRIEPTVMTGVTPECAVMQEEIFGPLLPVIEVDNVEEARDFVRNRPSPLALYLFTSDKRTKKMFLQNVSYGGGCINDTIIHLATSRMGFGGVGNSGMGSYHGKKSFETFSHEKSIVDKAVWLDLPMRYRPYKEFNEKLIRFFLK
ncbi:MAG: aldehyde dehydrogenase [Lachnospiraceae bacterium]|nr:aldehyde dehydrogenase [Lachnospiraceae bacterium]